MQAVLPLIANVVFATGIYFLFIVYFGGRETGEAMRGALMFGAIYGVVKVGILLFKRGRA